MKRLRSLLRGDGPPKAKPIDLIYFIWDGDHVKIGTSVNPIPRLKSLQTGNPRKLEILATMIGGRDTEKSLHDQFSHLRVSGEWFRPDAAMWKMIEDLAVIGS